LANLPIRAARSAAVRSSTKCIASDTSAGVKRSNGFEESASGVGDRCFAGGEAAGLLVEGIADRAFPLGQSLDGERELLVVVQTGGVRLRVKHVPGAREDRLAVDRRPERLAELPQVPRRAVEDPGALGQQRCGDVAFPEEALLAPRSEAGSLHLADQDARLIRARGEMLREESQRGGLGGSALDLPPDLGRVVRRHHPVDHHAEGLLAEAGECQAVSVGSAPWRNLRLDGLGRAAPAEDARYVERARALAALLQLLHGAAEHGRLCGHTIGLAEQDRPEARVFALAL
jgi:hypothetical protein